MFDRRAALVLPLALAIALGVSFGLDALTSRERVQPPIVREPESASEPRAVSMPPATGPLRWILAGGGPTPDLNQVQLEQDVLLARETLAPLGPGLTLFAGGPGSRAVQVLDESVVTDPLEGELAALFAPRPGRDASYRAANLTPDGAASAEAILAALVGALPDGDGPLTVYLAGHGEGGEEPRESRFLTWGPTDLWVEDLAATLDEVPGHRPVRFVITSCYSGGFAELAFRGADPEQGETDTDRCGLFATTWDRAASGCDPNPDRGAQEGYGIHFLHALRGEDREGKPLPLQQLDIDGDGTVSLIEAHTRARIASSSLDVPVTTSERFLRAVVDADAAAPEHAPVLLEERAAIDGLTVRLGLARPEEARDRLARVSGELERLSAELDRLEEALAMAEQALAAALLHRWPLLDDPWHPRFRAVLEGERRSIAAYLEDSAEAAERARISAEREPIAVDHDRLLVEAAPLERLTRALETTALVARLAALGGRDWLRYQALLACERGRP